RETAELHNLQDRNSAGFHSNTEKCTEVKRSKKVGKFSPPSPSSER
ncbi:uncharacterized, partial [Tachysurus ichikawai]